jgi:hypothetical protein
MTVEELSSRLTYSEFLEWVEFLELEEARHTKQDLYWAQIAAEIRRTIVKSPKDVKVKDFLFEMKAVEPPQATPKERVKKSKSAWLTLFGMKPKK